MATVEKVKKKKGKKIAPGLKDSDTPGQDSKTGSVISVREAQEDAKSDTIKVHHGTLLNRIPKQIVSSIADSKPYAFCVEQENNTQK